MKTLCFCRCKVESFTPFKRGNPIVFHNQNVPFDPQNRCLGKIYETHFSSEHLVLMLIWKNFNATSMGSMISNRSFVFD